MKTKIKSWKKVFTAHSETVVESQKSSGQVETHEFADSQIEQSFSLECVCGGGDSFSGEGKHKYFCFFCSFLLFLLWNWKVNLAYCLSILVSPFSDIFLITQMGLPSEKWPKKEALSLMAK